MKKLVSLAVSLFIFSFSLAILYLSMRKVMFIGGSCADGGPYVSARPCPEGVAWMLPLSIWVGMGSAAWYFFARSKFVAGPHWGYFFWSALFLSLGYNFFEFGFFSPVVDGVDWGFAICAIAFFFMGIFPLYALLASDGKRLESLRNLVIGKPTTATAFWENGWVLFFIHILSLLGGVFVALYLV